MITNVVLADEGQVASDGHLCLIDGTWSFAWLDAMLAIAWDFGLMLNHEHSKHWPERLNRRQKHAAI